MINHILHSVDVDVSVSISALVDGISISDDRLSVSQFVVLPREHKCGFDHDASANERSKQEPTSDHYWYFISWSTHNVDSAEESTKYAQSGYRKTHRVNILAHCCITLAKLL